MKRSTSLCPSPSRVAVFKPRPRARRSQIRPAKVAICGLSASIARGAPQHGWDGQQGAEHGQQDEVYTRLHLGHDHAGHIVPFLEDGTDLSPFPPDTNVDVPRSAVIVLTETG